MVAFLLGHWLEQHFVARIVSRETMKRFDFLMEHQGALVAFILFLIPGFPKDYLCFILGLSPMNFRVFLAVCTIGRIPGTLMLTLQGAQVYKGDYWSTIVLVGVCLLIAGLAYFFRDTLYDWIRRLEMSPSPEKDAETLNEVTYMNKPPVADFQELMNVVRGFRPAKILMVATDLEMFNHLEEPRTAAEIAGLVQANPRAVGILLDALAALGLITKDGEPFPER